MFKNRKFQMLVLIALTVIALVSTISAASPSDHSKRVMSWSPRPQFWQLKENNIAPSTYRERMGECFDVPVRELADCRDMSQKGSVIHVTGEDSTGLSDYYSRHIKTDPSEVVEGASDYFVRHPERRSLNVAVDTSDYVLRHQK